MSSHEQGFHFFPVRAFDQFAIVYPSLEIERRMVISVHPETADLTAKRLLIGSILAIYVMTPVALLRRVGTFDFGSTHTPLFAVPGNLLGDMRKIGGSQIRIHRAGLELHACR